MEGTWRGLAAWLAVTLAACALMAVASGCGSEDSNASQSAAIATKDPERTFAPLVEVAADEPWRPMSARWFIERAEFGFAEDQGCANRVIAVGRTMPERQNAVTDWIYPKGLGVGPNYYRNPYDASCENDFDHRFDANQLTRPYDGGRRAEGIRPGEGYYLDLSDDARGGPPPGAGDPGPAYAERTDEGDSQVRLTYWMLFGMHGTAGDPDAHEGDWERIDVLLRDAGDDRYEPLAVQVAPAESSVADAGSLEATAARRDTLWDDARRVGDTHPVVTLARATHEPAVADAGGAGDDCSGCRSIETWRSLAPARDQLWYGFGGAWGEVGDSDATTGPLGPHGFWPTALDGADQP